MERTRSPKAKVLLVMASGVLSGEKGEQVVRRLPAAFAYTLHIILPH